jgi:hypothetical protein
MTENGKANAVEPAASNRNDLAAFYRSRAMEARRLADRAIDSATREEWIKIANAWTALALHTER